MTRRRDAGFTLIEVMMAIVLTAVAVVGVTGLYIVETRSSAVSRHNTEGSVVAEDMMEILRTQTVPVSSADVVDEKAGTVGLYNRVWTVTPTAAGFSINVAVTWSEDGVNRTVTLISQRGP